MAPRTVSCGVPPLGCQLEFEIVLICMLLPQSRHQLRLLGYYQSVFDEAREGAVGGAGLVRSHIRAAWKVTAGAFLLAILFAPPVAGQTPRDSSVSRQSIELMVGHG